MSPQSQKSKAENFAKLHKPGEPVILVNCWDVASAGAVAKAGAKALATSSLAAAQAQGFADGEKLPREMLMAIAARIVAAHDLPLTVDCEAGYGQAPEAVGETARAVLAAGAIGLNLEDQVIGENRLFAIADQAARIKAARSAADKIGIALCINARTDIFLMAPRERHARAEVEAALERGRAYAQAGATSLFVPGVVDLGLITRICAESPLPVNIMASPLAPPAGDLAKAGVARISLGPFPFRAAMSALEAMAATYMKTGVVKAI